MNGSGDSTLAALADELPSAPGSAERLSIAIVTEAGDWSAFAAPERAIHAAAAALSEHPACQAALGAEASVVLGDDELVRRLNGAYRGKHRPTNVLSFPFQVPPGAAPNALIGDVVLAAETVMREALEREIPPVHHLQHLVVHGLLHLLGFGHETDAEAEHMERMESEVLAKLGVSDPHATGQDE